jgi:DNA-binding response OmpR family regulator
MAGSKKTVLVVEDDRELSSLLELALTHEGYDVVLAGDGEEGERQFRQNESVDLVLTDISLPKVTGDQLFYRLRAIAPDLRIIAYSGYSPQTVVGQMLKDGLHAFLPKPFLPSDLLALVANILRS